MNFIPLPKSNKLLKSHYDVPLEEFRKCSQPTPFLNTYNVISGSVFAGSSLFHNWMNNLPLYTALPRTFFRFAFGMWIGYWFKRWSRQRYFGEFKYSYEYALSRKGDFPVTGKETFADPSCLYPWSPVSRPRRN